MKLLITFLAFFYFGVIQAQNQNAVVLKTIDAETNNEISQVFISLKSENAWSFRKSHYEGEKIELEGIIIEIEKIEEHRIQKLRIFTNEPMKKIK